MTTTPTTLYTALLAAQRDFGAVTKNKQNPHLKNFYADLGAVLEAVTEPLANHGLLIVQRFNHNERGPVLITEIVHAASGEKLASEVPVVSKDPTDPQKVGGAITYYRRYSLLALLGLAPEDDDGHAASKPAAPRQQPAPAAPPRPQPAPTAVATFTPEQFGKTLDRVWEMLEDDKPYADLVTFLNAARPSMDAEMKEIARKELPKLQAAIKDRAAALNGRVPEPASFAG